MTNDKLCYAIWQFHNVLMIIPKFLLLIPAALFKNILALLFGLDRGIPLVGGAIESIFLSALSLIWIVVALPLILFSLLSRIPLVGFIFAVLGLPFAIIADIFLEISPSFGPLSNPEDSNACAYWAKVLIAESYPFSLEFAFHDTKRLKKRFQFGLLLGYYRGQPPINRFLDGYDGI